MTTTNDTPFGYSDRFDRSKDWKKLLFNPGASLQSSELNEIQSLLNSELAQVGRALFKEGGVLSGLDVSVNTETKKALISKGQVYALGYTHDTKESEIDLSLVGLETIGIILNQNVITELEDPTLNDPQIGYEAYGSSGSHRLTYTYEFVVNDPNAIKIVDILDGRIDQTFNQLRPGIDGVLELLASRTFDESGNYTVEPFEIEFKELDSDDPDANDKFNLILTNGRAYVRGFRVENEILYLPINKPVTTASRIDEPENFSSSTEIYTLDNTPIREITTITAILRSGITSFTRGFTPDSKDEIPSTLQPVANIISVSDGINGTYTLDTDYYHDGNFINWSLSGLEPASGASYSAIIDYVKELTKAERVLELVSNEAQIISGGQVTLSNTDVYTVKSATFGSTEYELNTDYTLSDNVVTFIQSPGNGNSVVFSYERWNHTIEGHYISRDSFRDSDNNLLLDAYKDQNYNYTPPSGDEFNLLTQISFQTATVDKPVDSTLVFYDYEYSLPRIDSLVVDYRGWFKIVEGEASLTPKSPALATSHMLVSKIFLEAEGNASSAKYELNDNQRLTMVNLRTLLNEVKDIQYNDAVFQLYAESDGISLPTDKRGIFADNFVTVDSSDIGNPDWEATIDILSRTCCLGQTLGEYELVPVSNNFNVDNYFFLNYTEAIIIQQPYATDTIQANPYTFVNLGAGITIDPKFDKFTNNLETIVNTQSQQISIPPRTIRNRVFLNMHADGKNIGDEWISNGAVQRLVPKDEWTEVLNQQKAQPGIAGRQKTGLQEVTQSKVVGNRIQTNTTRTVVESVSLTEAPFARQIEITVSGHDYLPNEDNIYALFNGNKVVLTPVSPTTVGTNVNTILADSDGKFSAKLTVPENTKSGDSLITIVGGGNDAGSTGAGSRAETTFHSKGLNRQVTQNVTITTTRRRVTTIEDSSAVDPIAQTFSVSTPVFIASIDIFFKSIPNANDKPVNVIIVPTQSGIPTQTILGYVELNPQDCVASDDASLATKFTFDHPVFLRDGQEYAFIVRTDSEKYVVHISRVGQNDPINGWVNKNPNTGVLLTSANMSTWTAEQNADIKFTMYRCEFDPTPVTIDFEKITFDCDKSRFELNAAFSDTSEGAMIIWQYSIDNQKWFDFSPPIEEDLMQAVPGIYIRAILNGNNLVSPVLHNNSILTAYSWIPDGAYIHRQFSLHEADCRYVNIYVEVNLPDNTSITPKVSLDSGAFLDLVEITNDEINLGNGWVEKHYEYDTGSDLDLKQDIITKVIFFSPNTYTTPRIRRYRVIATTI